jgi:hypothetical protein
MKERIMPSAFRTTLSSGADILGLANHENEKLLGRTSNRTLRVTETNKGLAVEIDMPDTSYARDLIELVKRGDIKGLSFGFRVRQNGQKFTKDSGVTIRELHDVDLREVSIVSQPAYPETSLALRSAELDEEVAMTLDPQKKNLTFPKKAAAKSMLLKQIIN